GRLAGNALESFPPATAYSINILASLSGVLSFLALSYLNLGPIVWFAVAALPLVYFTRRSRSAIACNLLGLILTIGILQFFRISNEYWSPYSKISLEEPVQPVNAQMLMSNNNGHQVLYDLSPQRLASRAGSTDPLWHLVETHQYIY